jgi:hypothetical protein
MTGPGTLRSHGLLTAGVLVALTLAGCGGGGATDDAVRAVGKAAGAGGDEALRGGGATFDDSERALPRLGSGIEEPAERVAAASAAAAVDRERVVSAMETAFCEGYGFYTQYGVFPTGDEWYDLIDSRVRQIAYPVPAQIAGVASLYQSWSNAIETGDITTAAVESYCAF